MKITLWDIRGFGRFNQTKTVPGSGFNLIFEPNESGKSTLQAFIRAMLYGQKGGRKAKDGGLPPAKRYKPWNGDQYAGVLEYALENGETFRIGRNFEKGTVNIIDSVSNNLTLNFPQDKDVGPRFAEEHLGLDEATFDRSVFLRQMQCAIDDDGRKSLVEKLSNLNTTGSEDLSLTRAINALDSTLLERVGTGRTTTRPLDKVNIRLSELEEKKQALSELNERYLDTVLSLHEKKTVLNELTSSLKTTKEQKDDLVRQRLDALKNTIASLKNESASLDPKLEDSRGRLFKLKAFENIKEDTALKAAILLHDIQQAEGGLQTETSSLLELQKKKEELNNTLDSEDDFHRRVEAIESKLQGYNPGSPAKDKTGNSRILKLGALGLGLMALVMLGLFFTASSYIYLGIGIALAVTGVIAFLVSVKKSAPGVDTLNLALTDAGFRDMGEFLKYKDNQLKLRSQEEQTAQQINHIRGRLTELNAKAETLRNQLKSLLDKAGVNTHLTELSAAVDALKRGAEGYRKAKEHQTALMAKKAEIENKCALKLMEAGHIYGMEISSPEELQQAISGFAGMGISQVSASASEQQLNAELTQLDEQIKKTQLEINTLNTRLEQAPSEGALSCVLEEIAAAREKKTDLETIGSSLSLARQVLSEAALKLQRDYIPELNTEMSSLMEHLTKGRYQRVRTNDELQVNLEVPETDEIIPVSRLSGGTIDQVYFCIRLAAVRLLEKGKEPLPLFLDEPFSQYDEERVKAAFEILKELSRERQIFFFTCREREFELAQSVFGDAMHRIKL